MRELRVGTFALQVVLRSERTLVFFLFLLNAVLISSVLYPSFAQINPADEARYITQGKSLAEGILPNFAFSPLLSFFYALIYLPVQNSPYWLILSCAIGRVFLFASLWLAMYLVARKINLGPRLLPMVLLIASPALAFILGNPSDALFAAMSGFAFWQVLCLCDSPKIKHLWLASAFVGLAALSRNDGILLFMIFVPLGLWLSRTTVPFIPALAAAIGPFFLLVGGYILLYGIVTGSFEVTTGERAYANFAVGEGVAFSELYEGKNAFIEGTIQSSVLYGTAEENNYSILNAIKHNPSAYSRRVLQNIKKLPQQIIFLYGGLFFSLFAVRGLIDLVQKKKFRLLALVLLWPAPLAVYIFTFYRGGYILTPYFLLLAVASMGVAATLNNKTSLRELVVWSLVLSALAINQWLDGNAGRMTEALVILLGLWIIKLIQYHYSEPRNYGFAGTGILVGIAFILHGSFPGFEFRTLGATPAEQAIVYMQDHLARDTRVGSYQAGSIYMARMHFVYVGYPLREMTDDQVAAWIEDEGLEAVYAEKNLKTFEPAVWKLIQNQIGKKLKVGFQTEDGNYQVLIVSSPH